MIVSNISTCLCKPYKTTFCAVLGYIKTNSVCVFSLCLVSSTLNVPKRLSLFYPTKAAHRPPHRTIDSTKRNFASQVRVCLCKFCHSFTVQAFIGSVFDSRDPFLRPQFTGTTADRYLSASYGTFYK
jgi:hypothetical protein